MKLYAPNGNEIIGTLETIHGRANIINEDVTRDESGIFNFEHTGETTVFWDGQETVELEKERVFLDEDGNEYPENTLVLK